MDVKYLLLHEPFSDFVNPGPQTHCADPSMYVILPGGQGTHSPGPVDNLDAFWGHAEQNIKSKLRGTCLVISVMYFFHVYT